MDAQEFMKKFGGGASEEYFFYNGEVTLRYFDKEHAYYLVVPGVGLEKQDGVTNVCHIIDKSNALIPWGCKMMQQKLLATIPGTAYVIAPEGKVGYIVTQEEIEKWTTEAKSSHSEKLEEAGTIGHIAHAWIEQYIKLELEHGVCEAVARAAPLPTDKQARKACEAALDWMASHNVRWKFTERKVYSRLYKYAGTMDGLCICDSCDNPRCCPHPFRDHLSIADWKTSNYLYMEYLFQTAAYDYAYCEETKELVEDRWIIRLGKDDGEFEAWHRENDSTFNLDFQGFSDALALTRTVQLVEANLKERRENLAAAIKAERDEARRVREEREREERAVAAAEKKRLRLEALALACIKSKKYKGKKKPSCKSGTDGGPCVSCAFKWAKNLEQKGLIT